MLFRGQSYRTLDPKARLMLPAEFKDSMASAEVTGFMLTTYDGCLVAYPLALWQDLEEKFSRLKNPTRKMRDFRRLILGGAEMQELDLQGRIRLSRAHLEYAGLEREVIVLGQGERFEIWGAARFKVLLDQDFDEVAEELAESGIDFML